MTTEDQYVTDDEARRIEKLDDKAIISEVRSWAGWNDDDGYDDDLLFSDDDEYADEIIVRSRRGKRSSSVQHQVVTPPDDGDSYLRFMENTPWLGRDQEWRFSARMRGGGLWPLAIWKIAFDRHLTFRDKLQSKYFSQGYFRSTQRVKEHAVWMAMIVFDVDGGQTFDEAVAILRERKIDSVVFTTWSHQTQKREAPACDRFRVVIRLPQQLVLADHGLGYIGDIPVRGADVWSRAYPEIGKALGLAFDPSCADVTRLHSFPSCHPDRYREARVVTVDGDPLDITQWMVAAAAIRKQEAERARQKRREREASLDDKDDAELDGELRHLEAHLSFIDPDIDYPDWWQIIIGVHSKFAETPIEEEALQLVIDWSAAGGKFVEGEVEKHWGNAQTGGSTTYGTVVHHARIGGFDPVEARRQAEQEEDDRHSKAVSEAAKMLRKLRIK